MSGDAGVTVGAVPTATGFEEFVVARSSALHRTAYLLTGSTHDADDLLQTTLVKLYVGWRRASAADSTEAYARQILVNTFISGRRPARFSRERLVHTAPDTSIADPDVDDRLSLWPHLQALPPRQRAVVVLRYYGGLTEAEIAAALGCAPGTVKSTASAALKTLRARLDALEEDR